MLLTVAEDGTAEGQLLPGTVSFMSARTHAAPAFGTPHWAAGLPEKARTTRHSPDRITVATEEVFHLRFLTQSAVPDAQMTEVGEVVHLVDAVTGSPPPSPPTGTVAPCSSAGRCTCGSGSSASWTAYDAADAPGPEKFTLHVRRRAALRHPQMPGLPLPRP